MGRKTYYRPMPDQSYDPRVTDLSNPLIPPAAAKVGQRKGYENRNAASTFPVQLVGNTPFRALPNNPRRTGLILQNRDAATPLFFSFAGTADANAASLSAGATLLLDFTTPATELWLFATANLLASVTEMFRTGAD